MVYQRLRRHIRMGSASERTITSRCRWHHSMTVSYVLQVWLAGVHTHGQQLQHHLNA